MRICLFKGLHTVGSLRVKTHEIPRWHSTSNGATKRVKKNLGTGQRHGIANKTPFNRQSSLNTVPPDPVASARAIQLLRAILRECTYLPDSFARTWTRQHTLSRFRAYTFKAWKHRRDSNDEGAWEGRFQAKEKEARQAFALLRRANEGERKCLLRVLLMVYGRIGKRRHELMRPLLPTKGSGAIQKLLRRGEKDMDELVDDVSSRDHTDDPETEPNIPTNANNFKPLPTGKYIPNLPPSLHALLSSQLHFPPPKLTRPPLRRLSLDIPDLNAWHRPMPQKRIRNMQQNHYADLLDRVLPPLPTQEWLRLRNLATGYLKAEEPVPRRKMQGSADDARESAALSALEMVVAYGKVPRKVFANREAHALTPRFMQRLYAQVFAQCPRMEWDGEKDGWEVVWGERALSGNYSGSGRNTNLSDVTLTNLDRATMDDSRDIVVRTG